MGVNKQTKTITMFLMEGVPNHRLYCELANWNGRMYRIPRGELLKTETDENHKEFFDENGAVYILLGKDDISGKTLAYIGETDNAKGRLSNHLANKPWWNEVIVLIRTNKEGLDKAQVRYLEQVFYDTAEVVDRCKLMNASHPGGATLSESRQSEMEEFIQNAKILMRAVGIKILEPVAIRTETYQDKSVDTPYYYMKAKDAEACGQPTADGFVVLKDSKITSGEPNSSTPEGYKNLRKTLIEEGVIKDCIFAKDYLFNSSSAAASVVAGSSKSGNKCWKNSNGELLEKLK